MKQESVSKAFIKDLQILIDQFLALDSDELNFSGFFKLWKKMKFYLIFHGLLHENQLHEFIDDVFENCLKKFESSDNYLEKIVLMFVIYSIYFKQPIENKFSIRITIKYLINIRDFLDTCKQKNDFEVIFCWFKLLSCNAVDFVYSINYYGPWFIQRQTFNKEMITMNTVDDQFCKNLQELTKFQLDYDKIKKNISNFEEEEISSLDLIEDKNLFDVYLNKFQNLKKKYDKE